MGASDQQNRLKLIFTLLRQTTSLDVVSGFLKSKGATHSASSWGDMYEKRIQPALEEHKISEADLLGLLRDAEECGRQHVFLYKVGGNKAIELIDRTRVTKLAQQNKLSDLLTSPKILDQPSEPTIVDVRWSSSSTQVDLALIVKIVETRVVQRFLDESSKGNLITRNYEQVHERAVNLARLHRNGLLEIRLGSHSNSSNYRHDLKRIWQRLSFLINESEFIPISLSTAKNKLWHDRAALTDLIRYSDSTLKNDHGNVIKAASGSDISNLFLDEGVHLWSMMLTVIVLIFGLRFMNMDRRRICMSF